jgi:hypothetical protein
MAAWRSRDAVDVDPDSILLLRAAPDDVHAAFLAPQESMRCASRAPRGGSRAGDGIV